MEDEFYEFEIQQLEQNGQSDNLAVMDNLSSSSPKTDFEIEEYTYSDKAILTRLSETLIVVAVLSILGVAIYYGYVLLRKHVLKRAPGADIESNQVKMLDDESEDENEQSNTKVKDTFNNLVKSKDKNDGDFDLTKGTETDTN